MAVDPNTGQSVINIPGFDQRYAQFVDPSQMGPLAAQQAQFGQQGQLGAALMQRGYIPNSGFGGAITQAVQAMMGMKMLKDSREQMAGLNQKMLESAQAAAQKKHDQDQADLDKATEREIHKAVGTHAGEGDYDLSVGPQKNTLEAAKAKLVADATLPDELTKLKVQGQNSINTAVAGARENNRGMKVEKNDDGTFSVFLPHTDAQGNIQVQSTNVGVPGAGKPNASQQAAIDAAKVNTEQFTQKAQAAAEARQHILNYTSQVTGIDPAKLATMSHDDIAKAVSSVGLGSHLGTMLPGNSGGPQSSADSAALSYAGTIRATPTDTDVKSAQALVPSPSDSMNTQAQKIKGMLGALDEVDKARAQSAQALDKLQPSNRRGNMSDPSQNPSAALGVGNVSAPTNGALSDQDLLKKYGGL
jgi:hypothetical protein